MSSSLFFLLALLSLAGGLIFSLFFKIWVIFPALFFFVFLSFFKKDPLFLLLFLFFFFGFLRGFFEILAYQRSPLLEINDTQKEVVFEGKIINEPEIKARYQRFIFQPQKIKGKILIYQKLENRYQKGERVKIKGKLKTPPVFEDFNYKEYLAKKGVLSISFYPEIKTQKEPPLFWRAIFLLKERSRKIIQKYLPPSESFLLRAMILGDKKELPRLLRENLNKTGLRHITAISGMHIMILVRVLFAFLLALGLWRKQAGILIILFLLFYLFFVGFRASIVRASIMGIGLIFAQILGRLPNNIRFLVLAGSLMLFFNPLIFFDVGFQLSFASALGINYLTPFLLKKLKFIPKIFQLRTILAMTLAVQIFTLPLLLYYFSYFSFASLLGNILILPFLPLVLGLGFLALFLGNLFSLLALFIFFPLSLLLAYILFLTSHLANLSFLGISFHLPLWLLLGYYLFLFFLVRKIVKKETYWFLEY